MKNQDQEFKKYATKHLGINSILLEDYSKKFQMQNQVPIITSIAEVPCSMTPYIMEERQMNVAQVDVFSRLMMDRIIFLGMPIDSTVANIVNAQMLFLESSDHKRDITIYINSPGGSVYDGLSIYDVMNIVRPKVSTVVTGLAASMAFVLASSGEKGKRMALRHSRLMQHQPLGGASGQASDIEITANEIKKLKKELYEIIAENTGQTYAKIESDCDRDYWMTSAEAKEYGVIDDIITKKK